MDLQLKVVKAPEDVDGTGNRFLATVEIFGVPHHLEFIRVEDAPEEEFCGGQRPVDPELQLNYEDLQGLYSGHYETLELPGVSGQFIAYMVPYCE